MATLFISHSSQNKEFALKLAEDLREFGHEVWLDQWKIRVGDSISRSISEGLDTADYVAVVLTPRAIESHWVEREWQARYGDEVSSGQTIVLPLLLEDCDIPSLLVDKLYADFRYKYHVGFVQLMAAVSPVLKDETEGADKEIRDRYGKGQDISDLLGRIHSRAVPLSQCITDALAIARNVGDKQLELFCRRELEGLRQDGRNLGDDVVYRANEAFVLIGGEINAQHYLWGGRVENVLSYMRRNSDEFHSVRALMPHPVSELEAKQIENPEEMIMSVNSTLGAYFPEVSDEHQDTPVTAYMDPRSFATVLESIRSKLTTELLRLLPSAPDQE